MPLDEATKNQMKEFIQIATELKKSFTEDEKETLNGFIKALKLEDCHNAI